ncbi:MAG: NAD(P)-dependent oxidoreductase [Velocimicrobium sp.]
MKVVVIQENIIQPDITAEEITSIWKTLIAFPEVTEVIVHCPEKYPSKKNLHTMIDDADAVFGLWIDKTCMSKEFLTQHPNLAYIATLGHGWEPFDVEMTKQRGLIISNTVYGAQTIAEYAFAMLMDICHNISYHSDFVKRTNWERSKNESEFCKTQLPQIELFNKTVGIIGLGSIGYAFAKMAHGFGMHVIAYSRHKKEGSQYDFIKQVSFDTLLEQSDVISLHTPFSASSADMINKESIGKMKDKVILINTARGGLIVEEDLADALNRGKIYAAGLDVLRDEPPKNDNPLLKCKNAYITGHIAWLTRDSRFRACQMAIENFKSYLAGKPKSIINE